MRPSSRQKHFKSNFPVTVKIRHLDIKQLFMLYGRLVHVGETFDRFADFGL